MGSTGKTSDTYEKFPFEFDIDHPNDYRNAVSDIFRNISNVQQWVAGLTPEEKAVIKDFIGTEYEDINSAQYNIAWEDMSDEDKNAISRLHNALQKFELKQGITVNRATGFRIFGATSDFETRTMDEIRTYLAEKGGYVQNDGFMSFSTRKDGIPVEDMGLVIHLDIPASKGAGAFLGNNLGIPRESEFLVNTNSVMYFDRDSLRTDEYGNIHINAKWLGRNKAQTISKTYKG